ncbi:MAG: nucleotide-binding domain containing protein [Spirochaetaceae bacterium]|nr:nucleotide-binding domain containing protein [Spirochaetaceae bacterium]
MAALKDESGLLFAGSSGLAEALAGVRRDGPCSRRERVSLGSALFMVGSVTPTANDQCARLASSGLATQIVVDGAAAAENEGPELRRVRSLVAGAPRDKAVLIRTSPVDAALSAPEARERGASISRFMGRVALAAARDRDIRILFASGGDTAARIVLAFGADYIEYFDEPLPGLPFGSFRSAALGRSLGFASKSGGFGAPGALVDVLSIATSPEQSERK